MNKNTRLFLIGGLLVTLSLAFFVSPFASSEPDGLNKVASDQGFDRNAEDHALEDSPVAGYRVEGVENDKLSKGLSGIIGVVLTFGIGAILFAAIRWQRDRRPRGSAATNTSG